MDIFIPEKVTRDIALFFVHGGGWKAASRNDFHNIMHGFNAKGYIQKARNFTGSSQR